MSKSGLLWSIQPPKGLPSYMFGTMHIRDQRAHQFCNRLYPFIEQVHVYIGEMDLTPAGMPTPTPLYRMQEYFQPQAYNKVKSQLQKSFGISLDQMAHLHPLLILSAITQQVLRNDHAVSIDEHLWEYATELGKPTAGLESVEEQVSILHAIPPDKLYAQIRQIGARPGLIRKFTHKTLTYYIRGEIHALYRMTKASMQHLRKMVIYERNHRMAQRINALSNDQSYFISVGAGHLSGPSGLISSLRKHGWKVKSVVY